MSASTATAATSEGSVSFSLKELTRLEDERVAFERAEVRRRQDERERARFEEARRAAEAEEQRAREEEERHRDEDRRAREEAARLDGMKRGLIERERAQAELAARESEMARVRAHELELARLRDAGGGLKVVSAWAIAALSTLALVGTSIAYVAVLRPDAERHVAEAKGEARQRGELVDRTAAQVSELGKRVDGLRSELQASQEHAKNLQAQLDDAQRKLGDRRGSGAATSPIPHRPAATPTRPTGLIDGPCKYPGDPLCSGK